MIKINGIEFNEKPAYCYECPFFLSGSTTLQPSMKGVCRLFSENHKSYIKPPKRCQKLFNKAFRYDDGAELVIIASDNNED